MDTRLEHVSSEAPPPARREPSTTGRASGAAPPMGALLALFAGIVALVGLDVAGDLRSGIGGTHVVIESAAGLLALAGVALALRATLHWLARARDRQADLSRDLSAARAEAERWRGEARQLVDGLSHAIDRQLERWKLTPAEKEVALLLLKGLSLKDVASLRGTSERTVRQQSLAIYRKSGLAGRAELSAFFLEDLLSPLSPRAGPPADAG